MHIHPFTSHEEKQPNEVNPDHERPKPIGSLEDETPIISISLQVVKDDWPTSIIVPGMPDTEYKPERRGSSEPINYWSTAISMLP